MSKVSGLVLGLCLLGNSAEALTCQETIATFKKAVKCNSSLDVLGCVALSGTIITSGGYLYSRQRLRSLKKLQDKINKAEAANKEFVRTQLYPAEGEVGRLKSELADAKTRLRGVDSDAEKYIRETVDYRAAKDIDTLPGVSEAYTAKASLELDLQHVRGMMAAKNQETTQNTPDVRMSEQLEMATARYNEVRGPALERLKAQYREQIIKERYTARAGDQELIPSLTKQIQAAEQHLAQVRNDFALFSEKNAVVPESYGYKMLDAEVPGALEKAKSWQKLSGRAALVGLVGTAVYAVSRASTVFAATRAFPYINTDADGKPVCAVDKRVQSVLDSPPEKVDEMCQIPEVQKYYEGCLASQNPKFPFYIRCGANGFQVLVQSSIYGQSLHEVSFDPKTPAVSSVHVSSDTSLEQWDGMKDFTLNFAQDGRRSNLTSAALGLHSSGNLCANIIDPAVCSRLMQPPTRTVTAEGLQKVWSQSLFFCRPNPGCKKIRCGLQLRRLNFSLLNDTCRWALRAVQKKTQMYAKHVLEVMVLLPTNTTGPTQNKAPAPSKRWGATFGNPRLVQTEESRQRVHQWLRFGS